MILDVLCLLDANVFELVARSNQKLVHIQCRCEILIGTNSNIVIHI